jgi:hemoglobin-like flavoprotein
VGLEDRDALQILHAAFKAGPPGEELIRRFYSRWFALDVSLRDKFPPDMTAQRAAFAHALNWVYGELVAQRAQEPVQFLAQLGRDHRKYGVTEAHYETLRQALYATLRSDLAEEWTDAVDEAARQSLNLITGVMSGAADADHGPACHRISCPGRSGRSGQHSDRRRDPARGPLATVQPAWRAAGRPRRR